jgi:hypothetical protein
VITNPPDRSPDSDHRIAASGPLATIVAAALAGAGLIHLAFAPEHLQTSGSHGAFFVAVAWMQLVLAGLILARRGGRATLAATIGVQAVVTGVWIVSRTAGIDGVVEPYGLPDGLAAAFAIVAVAGSALLLLGWHGPRVRGFVGGVATTLSSIVVIGLVTMSVSPALGGGHAAHEDGGHGHEAETAAAGHPHGAGGKGAGAHADGAGHADHATTVAGATGTAAHGDHDDHAGTAAAAGTAPSGHNHAATGGTTGTTAPHSDGHGDHGTGTTTPGGTVDPCARLITSISDPCLTAEQRARAQALLDNTKAALAKYNGMTNATLRSALVADGYGSIGDAGTGFEHFVHWPRLSDGIELEPTKVESIVLQRNPDGTWVLGSGMYILEPNKTMADVPEIAGSLTSWHDHQNLCWEGTRVVGLLVGGSCTRGTFRPTPPMLHVWATPQVCGPFTGIEGFGGSCDSHHH